MSDKLDVFWGNIKVGVLLLNPNRQFVFQYTPEWLGRGDALPISVSLPLRVEMFSGSAVEAFFANLLPESQVKEFIARRLGISRRNDFALLEALAGDCAGALSLRPSENKIQPFGSYDPLSINDLENILRQMPQRPMLSPVDGLRLSLAGAQDKLPVYVENEKFFLPKGSNPSSHILKPKIERVESSVENEYFCMQLAARLGMPVAPTKIIHLSSPVLLIDRYDRRRNAEGVLVRIHQEDLCQSLGIGYEQKYETEGGPSHKACFNILDRFSREPLRDKRNLLRWVLFNVLIGNNDAHGKNLSVLIEKEGIRLAPFYDLISTVIYPDLSPKMAMKIGGENRADWLRKDHWHTFAADAGVAPKFLTQLATDMLKALPGAMEEIQAKKTERTPAFINTGKITAHIERMAEKLRMAIE